MKVDGILGTDVSGLARGWGKTYRLAAGKMTWFHFPIPTTLSGTDQYLFTVAAYWTSDVPPAGGLVGVDRVHLWDGNKRILADDNPKYPRAGDWSIHRMDTAPDGSKLWNEWVPWRQTPDGPRRFLPQRGLGMSLHVVAQGEGNITFHGAVAHVLPEDAVPAEHTTMYSPG